MSPNDNLYTFQNFRILCFPCLFDNRTSKDDLQFVLGTKMTKRNIFIGCKTGRCKLSAIIVAKSFYVQ